MMGCHDQKAKQQVPGHTSIEEHVNLLNSFYARFDVRDTIQECDNFCKSLLNENVNDLTVDEEQVVNVFAGIKEHKAPGPDGVEGKILKRCSGQLASVFTFIFQNLLKLNKGIFPTSWKISHIVPIPKKPNARDLNDFRPIALTPLLAKCYEKIIRSRLMSNVSDKLDTYQFAYKARRGAEDACLTLFNLISKHLENSKSYLRILFIDFSSAFNTVEPLLILKRLAYLDVHPLIILTIRDFLRERPQRVCINGTFSDTIVTNTGCPQGCCLSPTLFSIYTDFMKCNTDFTSLFKFADDMALVGRLKNEDSIACYFNQASLLARWCEESYLHLNITKTKELVIGNDSTLEPLLINDQAVEVVNEFKYLGTLIDQKCNFNKNTTFISKKANQRLYLLRKLASFNINSTILENVYRSFVESILTYNITVWYGNLSVKNRSTLARIVKLGSKIVGRPQLQLDKLYLLAMRRKASAVLADSSHPLNPDFELMPSGRRFRTVFARKNLYKKSFIPSAITILNTHRNNAVD